MSFLFVSSSIFVRLYTKYSSDLGSELQDVLRQPAVRSKTQQSKKENRRLNDKFDNAKQVTHWSDRTIVIFDDILEEVKQDSRLAGTESEVQTAAQREWEH